jgi:hypothetical protein
LLPRWLNALLISGALFNFMAIFGVFTLSGPFNSSNGAITLGGPVLGATPWILMASAWLIATQLEERFTATTPTGRN